MRKIDRLLLSIQSLSLVATIFLPIRASANSAGLALSFAVENNSGLTVKSAGLRAAEITIKKRLQTFGQTAVVTEKNGFIAVDLATVPANLSEIVRLIESPGVVEFRIHPGGDLYCAGRCRPIAAASVVANVYGSQFVRFKPSDQIGFRDFTEEHIGSQMQIVMDGRVLTSAMLHTPIYDFGELGGPDYSLDELRFFAAILQSGPLPLRVRLVAKTPLVAE